MKPVKKFKKAWKHGEIVSHPCKQCSICHKYHPVENFSPNKHMKKGLKPECKYCAAKKQRQFNTENKIILRNKAKLRHIKNKQRDNSRNDLWRINLRKTVIEAYGNKCACCGEALFEFLTIDHIYGRGREHRKNITVKRYDSGSKLYTWLKNHNYPEEFQVLCYNCNCGKRTNKECPHEKYR